VDTLAAIDLIEFMIAFLGLLHPHTPIDLGRHTSDENIKLHSTSARAVPLETRGGRDDLQVACFIYITTASSMHHGIFSSS
jgi:hypothetical protein